MAKTHSTGKSVRNTTPASAAGRADARKPVPESTPQVAPVRPARRLPSDPLPLADTNMSVAGEEDPGAALDLFGHSGPTVPTPPASR